MNNAELRDAIRKALAGSSSQKPVDTKALLKLGDSTAISLALGELLDSREINTVTSTKGGITTVLCWLTGSVVLNPGRQNIRLDGTPIGSLRQPPQRPDLYQSASSTASPSTHERKEKAMNNKNTGKTGGTPSPITVAILKLVEEQPGIGKEALIEQALRLAPGASATQAGKSIGNLTNRSKKLRTEGGYGKKTYFLRDAKAAPAKVEKQAEAKKDKPAKPAEPVGAGHARDQKASRARPAPTRKAGDDDFGIMISEEGYVHIHLGVTLPPMNRGHIARISAFIDRFGGMVSE